MVRHTEIKTYTLHDSAEPGNDYAIKDLENIYSQPYLESEKPHRHDYYSIIFVEEGTGIHYIDFNEYTVDDKMIFFLTPGQMHQLIFLKQPKGRAILFNETFMMKNAITDNLINDIYLFDRHGEAPPMKLENNRFLQFSDLLRQMDETISGISSYKAEALGSLIKLFLIHSNNNCKLNSFTQSDLTKGGKHLLRPFKDLLDKQFSTSHMVSDYADQLAVTADYLNKVLKNLTGISAKEHIQNKLIIEAKRLLIFSNISNKELSYELGFDETAHFNNFFKKMTGLTPTEFKKYSES